MPGAVLLDLYGVLVDSEVTSRQYRQRLAHLLSARYGGKPHDWLRAHEVAREPYVAKVTRPGFFHGRAYLDALREAEEENLRTLFREAHATLPEGDLFELSAALDETIFGSIHSAYPESKRVLEELREMGLEIIVASGASLPQTRAHLRGSDLSSEIHGLLTSDHLGHRKDEQAFWEKAFQALRRDPWDCLVVDDALAYLRPAVRLGAPGVWIHRGGPPARPHFPLVGALGSLRGLPEIVRRLP